MTQPLLQHHRLYPGGDSVADVFEKLVGGSSKAYTVFNALETAAKRYGDIADEMRCLATTLSEREPQQGALITLNGACMMAEQFDRQEADVRAMLALLRGDDEPEGQG